MNDAPSARQRAEADRGVGREDDPPRNVEGLQVSGRDELAGDNAHGLLRVIGTVAEAEGRRRTELEAPKPLVHSLRDDVPAEPEGRNHESESGKHADERRDDDEDQRLRPASGNDDAEGHGPGDGRPGITANEGMAVARRQTE